ncbi:hypothetical protein KFE25_013128 [Diacronema lutheri]|uniref:Saccharopine dehydrogenase [NAD(+), L-lysine-forming] n=1 Tax=Diacronema lutheri TaxID=2081491 RepID=A0A8J6CAH1_DIALT|nr:hypothetical protein KFE25_013128 [Diacronema lutheri]
MPPYTIWLRHETARHETRTPLTPDGCADLLASGRIRVVVERSRARAYEDSEYARIGAELHEPAELADPGAWRAQPHKPGLLIVGLNALGTPEEHDALTIINDHALFARVLKPGSVGAARVLRAWRRGAESVQAPPLLYDYDSLHDTAGRLVGATMSRPAGFVGAAHGVRHWYHSRLRDKCGRPLHLPPPALASARSCAELLPPIRQLAAQSGAPAPRVLVVGALGRTGRGAVDACYGLGADVVEWDLPQTSGGGPFDELLQYDVVIIAVALRSAVKPLLTDDLIDASGEQRRLRVIVDVSCSVDQPLVNALPIYAAKASWEAPAVRVRHAPPLDVIAVGSLASAVGREASIGFSAALVGALRDFPDGRGWESARGAFERAMQAA